MQQHGDIKRAKEKVDILERDLQEMESELAEEIRELEGKMDAFTTALEPETLKPYKKDIDVQEVAILWLPCRGQEKGVPYSHKFWKDSFIPFSQYSIDCYTSPKIPNLSLLSEGFVGQMKQDIHPVSPARLPR